MGKDVCAVCGSRKFEFAGLQWWPIGVFERNGWEPVRTDPAHPNQGAVSMYICTVCRNSHLLICSASGGQEISCEGKLV
jgi:hypothetical protein